MPISKPNMPDWTRDLSFSLHPRGLRDRFSHVPKHRRDAVRFPVAVAGIAKTNSQQSQLGVLSMEIRSAQLLHSLDGTKHHSPLLCDSWRLNFNVILLNAGMVKIFKCS